MVKYPKIETIFKRDNNFRITPILNSSATIKALKLINELIVEEKIDGTNACLLITYNKCLGITYRYFSRNNEIIDQDIMYIKETLKRVIDFSKIEKWYIDNFIQNKEIEEGSEVRIYGEVFGDKIQKNYYTPKNVRDFRVFDIKIGNTWLSPSDRNNICQLIDLQTVPTIMTIPYLLSYEEFYNALHRDFNKSIVANEFGRDELLEGYIIRPKISLYTNKGRVIGKIKRTDFMTKNEYYKYMKKEK